MEWLFGAAAVVATVLVVRWGIRHTSKPDARDIERHTPDPATGTSPAEWGNATR
jgi:hypothetical protein